MFEKSVQCLSLMLILFLVLGFSGIFEEENKDEQEDEATSGFFKRALRRPTSKPPEGGNPNLVAHAQTGIFKHALSFSGLTLQPQPPIG